MPANILHNTKKKAVSFKSSGNNGNSSGSTTGSGGGGGSGGNGRGRSNYTDYRYQLRRFLCCVEQQYVEADLVLRQKDA